MNRYGQDSGRPAHEIRFWWRERGYLYRLCEVGGSNTPLLHRDLAYQYQDALIPDYDYSVGRRGGMASARPKFGREAGSIPDALPSQVSSGGAHAERRLNAGGIPLLHRNAKQVDAPRRLANTARQSGPLEQVSPVPSSSFAHAQPANNPAPVRPPGSGDTGAGTPSRRKP